jgi:MYND finger
MREVNFSIPNVNKASVNITTTLYDRRALDCTSTLPLINSLNHLAYLTTSSARIRDILTVDGGIERLVCILKEGRSKDLMEMWKWSLAFQCVVNIGVRGSEAVRTRVVEADVVPVIATILDNYIRVVDKIRARADADRSSSSRSTAQSAFVRDQAGLSSSSTSIFERSATLDQRSSRRQAPPPSIQIPLPFSHDHVHHHRHHHHSHNNANSNDNQDVDSTTFSQPALTSPPERTTFGRDIHNPRSHDLRYQNNAQEVRPMQPLATAVPTMDAADGVHHRPVQHTLRLPSMHLTSPRIAGLASQPDSPTTPNGPVQPRSVTQPTVQLVRPALRHIQSGSGDSDDANGEDSPMVDEGPAGDVSEPIVGVQNSMEIDNVDGGESMLENNESRGLTMADPSRTQDAETFNITHRSAVDGSIVNTTNPQAPGTLGFSPTNGPANPNSPALANSPYSTFLRTHNSPQSVLTAMPRDEDVLMALQLLAYVSKYCNLRTFFQNTHLVPKLKIGRELDLLNDSNNSTLSGEIADDDSETIGEEDEGESEGNEEEEQEEEYLLPDNFNIFPLVEKFTVRHHSKDMQYWACVVMRNLCRKDESRGGIRQCAHFECGKWEDYQRQFAKCRRCRRTKYCSKECQKAAWIWHRHWCHTTP